MLLTKVSAVLIPVTFLDKNSLLPRHQSAYRRRHSTETAVLKIVSDLFLATDRGQVSLLALLDLSAAFDTVDHTILLDRLQSAFGVRGSVFDWIESFITNRSDCSFRRRSVGRVKHPMRRPTRQCTRTNIVFALLRRRHEYRRTSWCHGALVR